MVKCMAVAVAVAVAVSGGGTVAVAGLTKRFFQSHPKRFLNQCLGLRQFNVTARGIFFNALFKSTICSSSKLC